MITKRSAFNKGIIRQYVVTIVVNIGQFMGGMSIGWPSPVIPQLLAPDSPFPISREEISWAVSIIHIAFLLSSVPCAYLMDKLGRKRSLLLFSIFPLSSWLLVLFTNSALLLCVARLFSGVWLGCIYTITPMYVAEIAEPQIRGSLGNLSSIMTNIGTVFVYVVGSYVTYYELALICCIVPVVFICTFVWMPESPYYYLVHKRHDEAKKTLMWLRDGDETQIQSELVRITDAVAREMENTGTIKELLATNGNRKALLITEILSINQKFSGATAIIAYVSITLPKEAFPSIGNEGCVIILGIIWIVTGIVLMFFIDRIGRKPLLFTSCFGCGISMIVLTIWYYLHEKTSIDVSLYNVVPFYALVLHGLSFYIGLGPIVNGIKGELFPSNVKTVASIITTLVLGVNSFIVNKMYLMLVQVSGMYLNFLIFSLFSLFGAVFTLAVVVETRGKNLQNIQIELNGGRVQKEKKMPC